MFLRSSLSKMTSFSLKENEMVVGLQSLVLTKMQKELTPFN